MLTPLPPKHHRDSEKRAVRRGSGEGGACDDIDKRAAENELPKRGAEE